MGWSGQQGLQPKSFVCGHCTRGVASAVGFYHDAGSREIRICPNCERPVYFERNGQFPDALPGDEVEHLPTDIANLYREARASSAASCYTASVLVCRKLLMNIAVGNGAAEGKSFIEYVTFLADKGYVPPNGRGWVDHIRKKGNEANHEIVLMSADDARELIGFLEMLLKFIYEFPNRIPNAT